MNERRNREEDEPMKNPEPPDVKRAAAESYTLMADPDPEKAVPGDLVVHENTIASIVRRGVELSLIHI